MSDGVGFVRLTLFAYPLRPVVHRLVRPVVIASRQRPPTLFGFCLPRRHQLPQGGHIDQHAVINMWGVSSFENYINTLGKGMQVVQHVFKLGYLLFELTTLAPLGGLSRSP